MPELPEVETIKRELQKAIVHKKIVGVIINDPYVIKEPGSSRFKNGLRKATITRILRRGKALIVELSSGKALIVHLRMTGQLVYPGSGAASRVSFLFSNGRQCDYNDRRRLGELRLVNSWQSVPFLAKLGPEPDQLKPKQFAMLLSQRKAKIKPLLMDQRCIAGVGNLYAAEALFKARIRPSRVAASLCDAEKRRLLSALCSIMKQAIKHRGSSIDQYVTVSGKRGNYAHFHKVYGREGKLCYVCKAAIERTVLGGRGTYFCARCQQ